MKVFRKVTFTISLQWCVILLLTIALYGIDERLSSYIDRRSSVGKVKYLLSKGCWFVPNMRHIFISTMFVCGHTSLQVKTHIHND